MAKRITDAAKTQAEIVEEKRAAAEKALLAGKAKEYSTAKADLDKAVDEYNTLVRKTVYDKFLKSDKPFVEFAGTVYYDGKRAKETRNNDTKVVEGVTVEGAKYRLKLKEFVEYGKIETKMLREISDLFTVLTIREQGIMTLKHEDFVKQSQFFCRVVADKESGKTPDSNTAICRRIQGIMDMAGIDCRVMNLDMHFIQQCSFVHNGKNIAQIKPVTAGKFVSVVVDMMAHFVQGIPYSILVKEQKKDA
jgi:hypothetical protein